MRVLAIIIQTKRGENIFVTTASDFPNELAYDYSKAIYGIIIQKFKRNQKIDRNFLFYRNVTCICNISKDFIIQILTANHQTFIGLDCLKKVNETIQKLQRNDSVQKRYIELFLTLEDMIYTREANLLRMTLPLKYTDIHSSKKSVDAEIIDKFPLVVNDNEKSVIQDVPLKYSYRTFSAKLNDMILQNIVSNLTIDNTELGSSSSETSINKLRNAMYSRAFSAKQPPVRTSTRRSTYNRRSQTTRRTSINTGNNTVTTPRGSSQNIVLVPNTQSQTTLPQTIVEESLNGVENQKSSEVKENRESYQTHREPAIIDKASRTNSNTSNTADLYNDIDDIIGNRPSNSTNVEFTTQNISPQKPADTQNAYDPQAAFGYTDEVLPKRSPSKTEVNILELDLTTTTEPSEERKFEPTPTYNQDFNNYEMYNSVVGPGTSRGPSVDAITSLKQLEKLNLGIKGGKIEEVRIMGQLSLDLKTELLGFGESSFYLSCEEPSNIWEDGKRISKKPSSNVVTLRPHTDNLFKVTLSQVKESQPIIDYIMNPKCLDSNKLPLLFVYKIETSAEGNAEITMQYKLNDKWNHALYDVEISLLLKEKLPTAHLKTSPTAHVIEPSKVAWRTKGLQPNSKGKLAVLIAKASMPTDGTIVDQFKIVFKAPTSTLEDMRFFVTPDSSVSVDQLNDERVFKSAQKKLFVEYRILA